MLWSSIKALLRSGCPAAISRFVVSIVVDTVDLQFRRTLAHVGKEIFEAEAPPVANRNAAPAVILKGPIFLVKAAIFYAFPNGVGRCSFSAVFKSTFVADLAARATASHLRDFAGDLLNSAIATNPPAVFHARFWCQSQNDKAPKTLTRDVVKDRHSGEYSTGFAVGEA